jgi:hypothetical protein
MKKLRNPMKRLVACVAAAVLLLSAAASVPASAGVLRASPCLSSYDAWATASGGGNVQIDFDVNAVSLADKVGVSQIVVQKKVGSSWTNVHTYSSATTISLLASNLISHCGDVTYAGTSGQQYRAVVTVYAKIGSISDSKTVTTNTVTA